MVGEDILKQIQIHNDRKTMYETEKEYLLKRMMQGKPQDIKEIDYSGMPHGSKDFTSFDRLWEDMRRIQDKIELEQWAIEKLETQKKDMKQKIADLKGLDAQVSYMRDFEGMRLKEIAEVLGYELNYIKKISARNPKDRS